jgi:hypothetical protein
MIYFEELEEILIFLSNFNYVYILGTLLEFVDACQFRLKSSNTNMALYVQTYLLFSLCNSLKMY